MTQTFDTSSVMFNAAGSEGFPTVEDLARTNWINPYMGPSEEFADWFVIAFDPRTLHYGDDDREAMDETNWDAIAADLESITEDGIPTAYYSPRIGASHYHDVPTGTDDVRAAGIGYLRVGYEFLIIAPNNDEGLDIARHLSKRLADYPLLDEDAYSKREWDAWEEYAPIAFEDEIRDAVRAGILTDDEAQTLSDSADELLPILSQYLHYNYGFSGDYAPKFLDIFADLMRADNA